MKNQKLIPFILSAALIATAGATYLTGTSETTSAASESTSENASEAVSITLNGSTAQADSDAVTVDGSNITITSEGTYILSGTLDNGSIIVDADKEAKVQLVLNCASIHLSPSKAGLKTACQTAALSS